MIKPILSKSKQNISNKNKVQQSKQREKLKISRQIRQKINNVHQMINQTRALINPNNHKFDPPFNPILYENEDYQAHNNQNKNKQSLNRQQQKSRMKGNRKSPIKRTIYEQGDISIQEEYYNDHNQHTQTWKQSQKDNLNRSPYEMIKISNYRQNANIKISIFLDDQIENQDYQNQYYQKLDYQNIKKSAHKQSNSTDKQSSPNIQNNSTYYSPLRINKFTSVGVSCDQDKLSDQQSQILNYSQDQINQKIKNIQIKSYQKGVSTNCISTRSDINMAEYKRVDFSLQQKLKQKQYMSSPIATSKQSNKSINHYESNKTIKIVSESIAQHQGDPALSSSHQGSIINLIDDEMLNQQNYYPQDQVQTLIERKIEKQNSQIKKHNKQQSQLQIKMILKQIKQHLHFNDQNNSNTKQRISQQNKQTYQQVNTQQQNQNDKISNENIYHKELSQVHQQEQQQTIQNYTLKQSFSNQNQFQFNRQLQKDQQSTIKLQNQNIIQSQLQQQNAQTIQIHKFAQITQVIKQIKQEKQIKQIKQINQVIKQNKRQKYDKNVQDTNILQSQKSFSDHLQGKRIIIRPDINRQLLESQNKYNFSAKNNDYISRVIQIQKQIPLENEQLIKKDFSNNKQIISYRKQSQDFINQTQNLRQQNDQKQKLYKTQQKQFSTPQYKKYFTKDINIKEVTKSLDSFKQQKNQQQTAHKTPSKLDNLQIQQLQIKQYQNQVHLQQNKDSKFNQLNYNLKKQINLNLINAFNIKLSEQNVSYRQSTKVNKNIKQALNKSIKQKVKQSPIKRKLKPTYYQTYHKLLTSRSRSRSNSHQKTNRQNRHHKSHFTNVNSKQMVFSTENMANDKIQAQIQQYQSATKIPQQTTLYQQIKDFLDSQKSNHSINPFSNIQDNKSYITKNQFKKYQKSIKQHKTHNQQHRNNAKQQKSNIKEQKGNRNQQKSNKKSEKGNKKQQSINKNKNVYLTQQKNLIAEDIFAEHKSKFLRTLQQKQKQQNGLNSHLNQQSNFLKTISPSHRPLSPRCQEITQRLYKKKQKSPCLKYEKLQNSVQKRKFNQIILQQMNLTGKYLSTCQIDQIYHKLTRNKQIISQKQMINLFYQIQKQKMNKLLSYRHHYK